MSFNTAIYAIPDLMTPGTPLQDARIIGPEDGSLELVVFEGTIGTLVNYVIHIPGWNMGVIKDPTYAYGKYEVPGALPKYPDYMQVTVEGEVQTNTLILPKDTLVQGLNLIEVCAGGKVTSFTVERPTFLIHQRYRDVTLNHRGADADLTQYLNAIHLVFAQKAEVTWKIMFRDAAGDPIDLSPYKVSMTMETSTGGYISPPVIQQNYPELGSATMDFPMYSPCVMYYRIEVAVTGTDEVVHLAKGHILVINTEETDSIYIETPLIFQNAL